MRTAYRHRARLATRLLSLPLLGLTGACGDATAPDRVIGGGLLLELVSGDDQTFVQGRASDSLVVRVVDINGGPQSGVTVEWRVVEGEGWFVGGTTQLQVLETTTDENGLAKARWRMGFRAWEQAIEVSAGNRSLQVEVVVEPEDWKDVLDIDFWAGIVDGYLRAQLRIANRWVSTIAFRPSCFFEAYLFRVDGQPVPGWTAGKCPGFISTQSLLAGRAIETPLTDSGWRIDAAELEPGIYAVVLTFYEGYKIHDRLANFHDITVLTVIE